MASNQSLNTLPILFFALVLCLKGTFGAIECENLNRDSCAFAVSSSGKRCVLEKRTRRTGVEMYTCRTSEIKADKLKDWIESEQCVKACGLDRDVLGISSDALLESRFTHNLCSSQCYNNCPNVVDLYFNLAAGEGVYLPKLCEAEGANIRREMSEIKSAGIVAPGPEPEGIKTAEYYKIAPAMTPY